MALYLRSPQNNTVNESILISPRQELEFVPHIYLEYPQKSHHFDLHNRFDCKSWFN